MKSIDDWEGLFWSKIYNDLDGLVLRVIPGTEMEMVETRDTCKDRILPWLGEKGFAHIHATYKSIASPVAYFKMVLRNRLLDCRRSILGRPRLPRWVQKKGLQWVEIYTLYYLKNEDPEQIVDAMTRMPHGLSSEQTMGILRTLWTRYPVDRSFPGEDAPNSLEPDERVDAPGAVTDQEPWDVYIPVERKEMHRMVAVLWAMLMERNPDEMLGMDDVPSWIWTLRERLVLDAEERLILQMIYRDDAGVSEVARTLRLTRHKVDNTKKNALQKIREVLTNLGFDQGDIKDLNGYHKHKEDSHDRGEV